MLAMISMAYICTRLPPPNRLTNRAFNLGMIMQVFRTAIAAIFMAGAAQAATVYDYQGLTFNDGRDAIVMRLTIDETMVPGGMRNAKFSASATWLEPLVLEGGLVSIETNYNVGNTPGPLVERLSEMSINVQLDHFGNIKHWVIRSTRREQYWRSTNLGDLQYFDHFGENGRPDTYAGSHVGTWTKPFSSPITVPLPASSGLISMAVAALMVLRRRRY